MRLGKKLISLSLALLTTITLLAAAQTGPAKVMFEAAKKKEVVDGDLNAAIQQYKAVVAKYPKERAIVADALIHMAQCYEKLGDAQSGKIYQEVISKYGDQKAAVAIARAQLGGGSPIQTTEEIFIGKTSAPGASPYGGPFGAEGTVGFYRPSPDGRYLAGTSSTRGLLLHEVSSNTDRQLTTDGPVSEPCFTPDSRRIVYASSFKDGRREIRIINVDGTGERTILRGDEYITLEPSGITSDGKTVSLGLFRKDNTWQVGMLSLETGKLTILKDNEWRDTYVGNFSPDSRWLVYQAQVSKDDRRSAAVYMVATDGSAHVTLTSATGANDFPFFTPDGSRVVFTVLREGRKDLWSVRVADGQPVGEPALAKADIQDVMGFARDGSFYYKKFTIRAGIYVAEVDPATWKLKSAPSEASNAFRYDDATNPAWSPDGKVLAYAAGNKIVLHRFDGTPDREMPAPSSFDARGWSADGKSLVGIEYSSADSSSGVRLFDLETQSERTIPGIPQGLLDFATDGKAVFYNTRDSGPYDGKMMTARLLRHDLQTGEESELYHTEAWNGLISDLKVSPDGRSLTFTKYDLPDGKSKSSWLLPVSGVEPRKLPSVGLGLLSWTQDSKALLFGRGGETLDEFWVLPVDGSQAYDTGLRTKGGSVSVHPDGSRIAFRKLTERVGQVSAIRNLFSKPSAAK